MVRLDMGQFQHNIIGTATKNFVTQTTQLNATQHNAMPRNAFQHHTCVPSGANGARGVSGGQLKRVNVGMEMVARPGQNQIVSMIVGIYKADVPINPS